MREIIKLGTVLMLYTLVAGTLLAFVYIKTAPIIELNKMAASGDPVRIQVLPGMEGGFEQRGEGSEFPYWIGYLDAGKKKPGGYIFIARGKGYSSTIETMVGIDIDGTITGTKVLFHQETPGLGDKIEEIRYGEDEPWFTRQFIGKSASDNLAFTKDDGVIDAITGATISSSAVTKSIIIGLNNLKDTLTGKTFPKRAVPEKEEEEDDLMAQLMSQVEESDDEEDDLMAQLMKQVDDEEEAEIEITGISVDEMLTEVLPDMDGGYDKQGGVSELTYWVGYQDSGKSRPGGYIFIASGEGFVSIIETMVGVNVDGKIVGVKIVSHEETPEYADKFEEIREGEDDPWFTSQFIGKSASDNIAFKENGGDIDAVSGATVSSTAVSESINTGLKKLMEIVKSSSK